MASQFVGFIGAHLESNFNKHSGQNPTLDLVNLNKKHRSRLRPIVKFVQLFVFISEIRLSLPSTKHWLIRWRKDHVSTTSPAGAPLWEDSSHKLTDSTVFLTSSVRQEKCFNPVVVAGICETSQVNHQNTFMKLSIRPHLSFWRKRCVLWCGEIMILIELYLPQKGSFTSHRTWSSWNFVTIRKFIVCFLVLGNNLEASPFSFWSSASGT